MKKTPLKRSKIRKESEKQRKKNANYRKACPIKDVPCWNCGDRATSRHHLYSQAQKPEIDTEPLNLMPLCQTCHDLAEQDHRVWRQLVAKLEPKRMAELDHLSRTVGKDNKTRMFE